MDDYISVVFDGPPDHVAPRFIAGENSQGRSIGIGSWVERDDGYWELRLPVKKDTE